jgi:5'-nucleotidase
MRILVTNDDGIHAEGLQALEAIANSLSDDVWVCAPEVEQSGAGRSLTLSAPLRVRRLSEKRFAVAGTPTDCVLLALQDLVEGRKPDLVLSGVNRGQNLGEDVTVSGTVAGAMQGMALGVPAIALSQAMARFHDDERALFQTAETYAPGIIRQLLKIGWPDEVIINVNFPDLEPEDVREVEVCAQGLRDVQNGHAERRTDLRGRHYYWMGWRGDPDNAPPGTDLYAVRHGRISVTPLHIDLTHRPTMHALKGLLGGPPPKA